MWRRLLRDKGLDIHSDIFDTRLYNEWIKNSGSSIPLLPVCQAVLVGNSNYLWPFFKEYLAQQRILGRSQIEHPLDEYVKKSVAACFPTLEGKSIRFSDDVGDRFVHIQRIADVSGLAYLDKTVFPFFFNFSKAHLSIHPKFGAWVSLRAVIIFPEEFDLSGVPISTGFGAVNPDPSSNHDNTSRKLIAEFSETNDKEKLIEMRNVISQFTEKDHSFNREQIEFHYGINRSL
jgi:hypothetical protein